MKIIYYEKYYCQCGMHEYGEKHDGRNTTPEGKGTLMGYYPVHQSATFCCEDMKRAWEENVIGFGRGDDYGGKNTEINIRHWSCYPEGACCEDFSINICPWCAKKVKTIKRTDSEKEKEVVGS